MFFEDSISTKLYQFHILLDASLSKVNLYLLSNLWQKQECQNVPLKRLFIQKSVYFGTTALLIAMSYRHFFAIIILSKPHQKPTRLIGQKPNERQRAPWWLTTFCHPVFVLNHAFLTTLHTCLSRLTTPPGFSLAGHFSWLDNSSTNFPEEIKEPHSWVYTSVTDNNWLWCQGIREWVKRWWW